VYKFMIVLLLVVVAGLFFIPGPGDQPILKLEDFKPDLTLPETISELLEEAQAEDQNQITRVYKWRDENGDWQFSNRPEDANGAETIELDGVINSMGSLDEAIKNAPAAAAPTQTPSYPSLTTIPLSQAMDTLDKARQMQETIDSRKSKLDKAIGTN
jgi:hypothetical protein